MSGHSKWSTIKRQKGLNDAKRGQTFTKLAKAITVAVREGGGGDPATNIRLRLAIDKARVDNMPKDNIGRAIDRGGGVSGGAQLESVTYEGFGPAGVAVVVDAITDNRNRTTPEIRSTFEKAGGTVATPGAVSWQFDQVGVITLAVGGHDVDALTLDAIDAGAQDVEMVDDVLEIYTSPIELHAVKEAVEAKGYQLTSAQITLKPKQVVTITNPEDVQKVITFLDRLDALDDVSEVHTNADIVA